MQITERINPKAQSLHHRDSVPKTSDLREGEAEEDGKKAGWWEEPS